MSEFIPNSVRGRDALTPGLVAWRALGEVDVVKFNVKEIFYAHGSVYTADLPHLTADTPYVAL